MRRPGSLTATTFGLALCLALRPAPAHSCIGPPRVDLWYLATESDVIAVGEVTAVRPSPLTRLSGLLESADSALHELEASARGTLAGDLAMVALDRLPGTLYATSFVATVEIEEILVFDRVLGRAAPTTLHFWFELGTGFVPGERSVVFARRGALRLETWFANGAIPVADEVELEDLLEAVRSARALGTTSVDESATVAWRVETARYPGVIEHLLGQLGYDELTFEQTQRLAELFVQRPVSGRRLVDFLEALGCHDDPRIDRLAIALVEATPDHSWLEGAVGDLLNRRLQAKNGVCPQPAFECSVAGRATPGSTDLSWVEIVTVWFPRGLPAHEFERVRAFVEVDRTRWATLETRYLAAYERWR